MVITCNKGGYFMIKYYVILTVIGYLGGELECPLSDSRLFLFFCLQTEL
jgi:hypothetical protein